MLLLTAGIVGVLCNPALGTGEDAGPADERAWMWGHLIAAAAVLAATAILSRRRTWGRGVGEHPFWAYLACGALTWFAQQAAMTVAAQLLGAGSSNLPLREQAIIHGAGALTGMTAGLVLVRLVAMSAPEAGLRVRGRGLVAGVLLSAAAWPIAQSAAIIAAWGVRGITGGEPEQIGHPTLQALVDDPANPWALLLGASAIIGAPVVEEVIFRGFLQSALLRLSGQVWLSVVATGALFALVHAGQGMPWHALASVSALGLCLGFAMERTRSLSVCIGMHMGFNGANVALALWLTG
jgi:membrane protease YdiL (CAAX protease family)